MNAQRFRFALLTSLGLAPIGCGGSTLGDGPKKSQPACTSPQAVPGDTLVMCEEGYTHRLASATCGSGADQRSLPRAAGESCELDTTVCDAFQFGFCTSGQFGGPLCQSGCSTDQDCGDGGLCVCGAGSQEFGACEYGSCRSDDECEPGYRCASYTMGCGGGYACQTPEDTCTSDRDCKANESCYPQAVGGHRVCAGRAVCGRPFLVASQPRLAPIMRRSDWLLHPELA